MKTVWIYVNTDAIPGDGDHLQVFATEEAAQRWFDETIWQALPSNIRFTTSQTICPRTIIGMRC
jgi:hypothetical protein